MGVKFLDPGFGESDPGKLEHFSATLYEQSDQAFYRLALTSNFYKAGVGAAALGAQIGSAGDPGMTGAQQGALAGDIGRTLKGDTVFERALNIVFTNEGGFTIDNGGPTMRGVTWTDYNKYYKRLGLPYISNAEAHIPGGIFEKTITRAVATTIFKLGYWDTSFCDDLVKRGWNKSAMVCLDISINGGDGRAKQFLREYLKVATNSQLPAAISTAVIEDVTFANWLNDRMNAFRKAAKGGKLWVVYGRGWQRRYEYIKHQIPGFH